jgi:hypothetical protein
MLLGAGSRPPARRPVPPVQFPLDMSAVPLIISSLSGLPGCFVDKGARSDIHSGGSDCTAKPNLIVAQGASHSPPARRFGIGFEQ